MDSSYAALFVGFIILVLLSPVIAEIIAVDSPEEVQVASQLDGVFSRRIEDALKITGGTGPSYDDSAYVEVVENFKRFTELELQSHVKSWQKKMKQDHTTYWDVGGAKAVIASAPGTNNIHHFVNGYLVGYCPFETKLTWAPLYAISMRLRYQLDSKQYAGLSEVWQTSKQAFFNTRGDCEDHALILADWLIELGVDARVVMGKWGDDGHAWVVAFKEGQAYLLEATDKRKRKGWCFYPLAKLATDYHPRCMFNRDYFWTNTGSHLTTDYEGKNWKKKSRYFSS